MNQLILSSTPGGWDMENKMEATILENQTGIIYQDPPRTLNCEDMVPTRGYLGPNRG